MSALPGPPAILSAQLVWQLLPRIAWIRAPVRMRVCGSSTLQPVPWGTYRTPLSSGYRVSGRRTRMVKVKAKYIIDGHKVLKKLNVCNLFTHFCV